ncbi:MAG: hypothetical protein MZU79_00510 [Anaerotruncus sp.]|nr:hypothetical protein [Anaerotruncus sp.]
MIPEGGHGAEAKMKLLQRFDADVSKPVDPEELHEALTKALSEVPELEAVDEDSLGPGGTKSRGRPLRPPPCGGPRGQPGAIHPASGAAGMPRHRGLGRSGSPGSGDPRPPSTWCSWTSSCPA